VGAWGQRPQRFCHREDWRSQAVAISQAGTTSEIAALRSQRLVVRHGEGD